MIEPNLSKKLFRLIFKRSQNHRNVSFNRQARLGDRVIMVLGIKINMYW